MGILRVSARLALVAAALFSFTACAKIWEIGQKLKAPEPPAPEEVVIVEETPADGGEGSLEEVPPPPEQTGPVIDPDIEVSILGYHDFSRTRRITDMVMHPGKLREQMETLKKNEIPVIPMSDYLAWKKGEKNIPDPCVVISIDDGWEGVYTEAYPIFKEYGYPFSIYLYKNYIGGGGRSLSYDEIREMMDHGCEIGSHSVSHADMARRSNDKEWLRVELEDSLTFLRENFGTEKVLPVFAYPYGKYNAEVVEMARALGYELGVTVAPKKAGYDLPDFEVGRYIIHGTNDININYAMSFKGSASVADGNLLTTASAGGEEGEEEGEPLVVMWPQDASRIGDRMPRIQVDISKLEGVIQDSLSMQVSGFGKVPFAYDSGTGLIHYQITEPLRSEFCRVSVRLQRRGQPKADYINWSFQIDRNEIYLTEPLRAQPIEVEAAADGGPDYGEPAA